MKAEHSLVRPARPSEPAPHVALARVDLVADDRDPTPRGKVAELIGEGSRVLLIGEPGAGLLDSLRDAGCDVVAVGPGTVTEPTGAEPHLADAGRDAEDERFDAAVLVNALEHVPDPLATLRAARSQLRRTGHLVVQVANVGHGNVRLALLGGRFPFAADPAAAPVRFFTYESLVTLLEKAGFAVGVVERDEADIDPTGGPTDPDLMTALNRDPDARTTRFVVAAYPVPWPGLAWLQRRLRGLVEQAAAADREVIALRYDLDAVNAHVRLLVEQQDASLRREADLRAKVLEAHDTLRTRDHELRQAHDAAHEVAARAAAAHDRVAVLDGEWAHTRAALAQVEGRAAAGDELAARLHATEAELAELRHQAHLLLVDRDAYRARMDVFRRSLIGRAYHRTRRLLGKS